MMHAVHTALPWLAVAWPLALAVPALHARVPRPCHLAVLPAAALALWPGEPSRSIPWIVFGTGMGMDGDTRWILAMSVVVWLAAATAIRPWSHAPEHSRTTTFFTLTLGGNLGAVLATELTGFFIFSTVMGYGIYALLLARGDDAARGAARLYVVLLILADLALFEALLLAATTTQDLGYEAVRRAMAEPGAPALYAWVAFAGFALRAGLWPAHLWLAPAFGAAPRAAALLLGAGPVAVGLLGAIRWLPVGEAAIAALGSAAQALGAAAALYAAARIAMRAPLKSAPAWACVALTGLLAAALGHGLGDPAAWHRYGVLAHPLIASLGTLVAVLTLLVARLEPERARLASISPGVAAPPSAAERWLDEARGSLTGAASRVGFLWSGWSSEVLVRSRRVSDRGRLLDACERALQRWPLSIALLVLVGLIAALLGWA